MDDKHTIDHASMMIITDVMEEKTEDEISDFEDFLPFLKKAWSGYFPKNTLKRLNLKPEETMNKLRAKISERVLKK